jgi:hypothetical protein
MRVRIAAILLAGVLAVSSFPMLALTQGKGSKSGATAKKIDWENALKTVLQGAEQGMKAGVPKEKISYTDDQQVAQDISGSMKARITRIRVDVPGFDTQEMVPGVIVFAKAVKETGGQIVYCKVDQQRGLGGIALSFILPELVKSGKDWIAAEMARAQIPGLARSYHVFAYVRDDNRTAEYVLFRKRDLGPSCESPQLKGEEKKPIKGK